MRGQTAVYRLFSADDVLLYVGISKNFGLRWQQHAHERPWWPEVHHQTITWYGTHGEADEAETAAITAEKPLRNVAKVPRIWDGDPEIRQRLVTANDAFKEGTARLRLERQEAVMEAKRAGWTKYKIAAAMGVRAPTLDSIIEAAEKREQEQP